MHIKNYLKRKPEIARKFEKYEIPGFFKRKQIEEELKKSEKRFKDITENTMEWIWEVDANGLYTYSSPVIEKILGYKPEEVVGKKHFYDFFSPTEKEKLKKALTGDALKEDIRKDIGVPLKTYAKKMKKVPVPVIADPLTKKDAPRIKTNTAFDEILGGGLRAGQMCEMYGVYGSAKTQTAFTLAVEADGLVVFIDSEEYADRKEFLRSLNYTNCQNIEGTKIFCFRGEDVISEWLKETGCENIDIIRYNIK